MKAVCSTCNHNNINKWNIVYMGCLFNFGLRLIVHADIDGNSRVLTFINVDPNNRAQTVLSSFLHGVSEYGIPSRV